MHRSLVATLLLALTAATMTVATGAEILSVVQKGRAFSIKNLAIHRGDTVRFVNDDTFTHQVFINSPRFTFDSDEQEPGTKVDVTFPVAGTFDVLCHIHPKMLLHVEVN